jgi:hypothetical protein
LPDAHAYGDFAINDAVADAFGKDHPSVASLRG